MDSWDPTTCLIDFLWYTTFSFLFVYLCLDLDLNFKFFSPLNYHHYLRKERRQRLHKQSSTQYVRVQCAQNKLWAYVKFILIKWLRSVPDSSIINQQFEWQIYIKCHKMRELKWNEKKTEIKQDKTHALNMQFTVKPPGNMYHVFENHIVNMLKCIHRVAPLT